MGNYHARCGAGEKPEVATPEAYLSLSCTIPNFVKILAYARSFGIGITPILQSLEQIKNMYKDEWGVIVDNCNELLYLGSITHMDTLEYISKLLGKGTFDKRTTGRTRGRQGSSSENFDVVGRELMTVDEIRQLKKENCLLVIGGRSPFYSEKYDYTSHPNYRYTSDGNHAYSYHYMPELPPWEKPNPHREEEQTSIIQKIVDKPSEQASIGIEESVLIEEPRQLLKEMTEKFSELQPISDELMNDGELSPEQEDIFFNTLLAEDQEEENRISTYMEVSAETREYLENIENNLPHLEENPVILLNQIGSIVQELAPLPDEYENAEESVVIIEKTEVEIEENVEKIIMDNETVTVEELDDVNGDIFGELQGLADLVGKLPEFKELLDEST